MCTDNVVCFAGTHNQNIQVYDVASLKHMCSLTGHIGIVTVLRVTETPHGQFMFSASSDTTVQVSVHVYNYIPSLETTPSPGKGVWFQG